MLRTPMRTWTLRAGAIIAGAALVATVTTSASAAPKLCPDGWCGPWGTIEEQPALNVRSGPTLTSSVNGQAKYQDSVEVRCYTTGDYVSQGLWPSNIWDHITDTWVSTTADIRTLVRHC